MREILYDFVELESEESFRNLGNAFNAIYTQNVLLFDNSYAKGEIVKACPEAGLWVRKWKLTVLDKITLQRNVAPEHHEKKFSLIYFLNPSIFNLKGRSRAIKFGSRQSNLLLSNKLPMQFNVLPNQPFFVLDITFTSAWLIGQFSDGDKCFKQLLESYLDQYTFQVSIRPCLAQECKVLQELEQSMQPLQQEALFIRSRIYTLVWSFFNDVLKTNTDRPKQMSIHYDQMVQVETMLSQQFETRPKIDEIAKKVNMSVSTLVRQFKTMYGKSVYEYHIEKKMELAKKMIQEEKISIKEVAKMVGYKRVSPFIESFTKQYGCTPGSLKIKNSTSESSETTF
jgi:AraC-like DNA-binding protein